MTDEKINPEALRSAIQERIQLAEAATKGPWRYDEDDDGHEAVAAGAVLVHSHYPDDVGVALGAHDGAFIAAHDPSFMLRVYRQWLDVLDRHRRYWFDLGGSHCTVCGFYAEPDMSWPCPEVRSVAAALGLNEEET